MTYITYFTSRPIKDNQAMMKQNQREMRDAMALFETNQELMFNEQGQIVNQQGEILIQLKNIHGMASQSSNVTRQFIQSYNQRLTEINQDLSARNEKMFGQTCATISATLGQSFDISADSQSMGNFKDLVRIIISETFALEEINDLTKAIMAIESRFELGTLITQYSQYTQNLNTIFGHFDQAEKGPGGVLKDSQQLKWFKDSALNANTGIVPSISMLFDMLNGGNSIWNGGKNLFQVAPDFGCQEGTFQYFMMTINKAIKLMRRAMSLQDQSLETYEGDWHFKTAQAYAAYFKECGCPSGLHLEKSGNISQLVSQLPPNPTNDFTQNLKKVNQLDEGSFFRQKAQTVLEIQNFDITPQSVKLLDNFWYEDVEVLSSLMKEGKLALSNLYDGIEKCISPEKNCQVSLLSNDAACPKPCEVS